MKHIFGVFGFGVAEPERNFALLLRKDKYKKRGKRFSARAPSFKRKRRALPPFPLIAEVDELQRLRNAERFYERDNVLQIIAFFARYAQFVALY